MVAEILIALKKYVVMEKNKYLSTDLSSLVDPRVAVLILRIGAGALILTHGIPKLMMVFSGNFGFADPIGLGPELSLILSAFAEGICGLAILFGLWTRLAAIPLIINMTVVAFIAHAGDPFGDKEKGLLFLVMFIVLFLTGGGKFSVDEKLYGESRVTADQLNT